MAWKEETIMSQKIAFIQAISEGKKPFNQICDDFGISRQAGYKTLKRYKAKGEEGLLSLSRRPLSSPKKISLEIEEKIIAIRIKHPTWGARKINSILKSKIENCPSISTISAILKRSGYIETEESLKRKKLIRFEREYANDLWQMDFKGKFRLENDARCFPLTIIDDYSRFSLGLKSCANERTNTVLKHLYAIFSEYGLPNQFNVDNGNPWGNSCIVKHTYLTVWLMKLGIKVTHSRPRHPQTNGKLERFHRTLKEDVINRNQIQDFDHAQELFNDWREIYNHERPHEAIGMIPPIKRYTSSKNMMPSKLPTIEYGQDAMVMKVRSNGGVIYKNKEFQVGKAFQGLYVQIKPNELQKIMEIYFGNNRIHISNMA
jgi:transposase InsO family protein